LFGEVLKNSPQFLNIEKYFSNNSYSNAFSDVAATTNTIFKTNHKTILFIKKNFRKKKKKKKNLLAFSYRNRNVLKTHALLQEWRQPLLLILKLNSLEMDQPPFTRG
jgi:hypothetical protein